ncbi:hypothetical protein [Paenibacillus sp. V4I7]|uniref:hypothetical protein n=1 Tax=Paenibacillus sp. V4I7 TaxID=3042307 RepID=UPI0027888D89|nr:hypothetical protein [Paenibacillus sp. V4I7]MDQ0899947.1 putative transposase [Paenibacillus sp. V4I7]
MKTVLCTMKIKLLTDEEQHRMLTETMTRFHEVCNYISEVSFQQGTYRNKIKIMNVHYQSLRENYNFPSQMVVRAVGKVVQNYKEVKGKPKEPLVFKDNTSVVYDSRTLSFKGLSKASIRTLEGRIDVPVIMQGYHQGTISKRVEGQSDLIKVDNEFHLLYVLDLPETESISPFDFVNIKIN